MPRYRPCEEALSRWLKRGGPDLGDTIALDGNTLRGSASYQVRSVFRRLRGPNALHGAPSD
jgi:hypothetical protein